MSDIQRFNLPKTALHWLSGSSFEPVAVEVGVTLSRAGYSSRTVSSYLSCISHFSYWCSCEKITPNRADSSAVDRFLDEHLTVCRCAPRCRWSRIEVRAALHRWLDVAQRLGVIQLVPPDCPANIKLELQALDAYHDEVRGLALVTRETRLKYLHQFLWRLFGSGDVVITTLTPADITDYVVTYCKGWKPASVKVLCGSLRSYFRFKSVHGASTGKLISSLPKVADWTLSGLPKALSEVEVRTLLDSFDQGSLGGQRDYAIARCYIDLGLRTAELVRLQLDDIDWRHGVLSVQGKGRRVDALPLPQATGQAIARYLQHRPAETKTRAVFLRLHAPLDQPAVADTIRGSIRNAAKRCGLSARLTGPHRFRHTLATNLVQTGASLKDVSDLMRHRNLDTTTLYAKVDLDGLSKVVSPWPGAQS